MRVMIIWVFLAAICLAQKPPVVVDVTETVVKAKQDDKPVLPDDYGQEQAGGIIASWTMPAPAVKSAPPVETTVAGVTLFTSNGWDCAPCVRQGNILRQAGMVDAQGNPTTLFRIIKVSQREATRLGGVPRWVPDDGSAVYVGARTAETLRPWLASKARKVNTDLSRWSRQDLDEWVRDHYKKTDELTTYVDPPSNVWNHLTDKASPEHTFTKEQVDGLEQWVALALHDAIHQKPPKITPYSPISSDSPISANSPAHWTVDVASGNSKAIIAAVVELTRRQDDTRPAVKGFLPALPVDVNDGLLQVLDSLLSDKGYGSDGFRVSWGEGIRRVTFEPGLSIWVKKVVEADATITAIEVDGRNVTLTLKGTIVNKLTVRLK